MTDLKKMLSMSLFLCLIFTPTKLKLTEKLSFCHFLICTQPFTVLSLLDAVRVIFNCKAQDTCQNTPPELYLRGKLIFKH